jgi:hypothetical protein
MDNGLDYINKYYGLSVKIGDLIKYSGGAGMSVLMVTGTKGAHLICTNLISGISGFYHPIWEMHYNKEQD